MEETLEEKSMEGQIQEQTQVQEQVQERTQEQADDTIIYAGFWARFLASILDSLVIGIPMAIVMYFSYDKVIEASIMLIYGQEFDWRRELTSEIFIMAVSLAFWIYKAATPGKMLMGMKIVDATTGKKPSAAMLTVRYLAYIVSLLPLFLGFIWVAFDKRKQGFHDKLANTLVIMAPAKEKLADVDED